MKIVKLFKWEGWKWRGANKRATESRPVFNELSHWREQMIFARWLGYKQEEILITGDGCQRSEDFLQPEMSCTSRNSGTFNLSEGVLEKRKHAWVFSGRTDSETETNGEEIIPDAAAAAAYFANLQLHKCGVTCLSCWLVCCLLMAALLLFTALHHQGKSNISSFMEINLYEHRCLIF